MNLFKVSLWLFSDVDQDDLILFLELSYANLPLRQFVSAM